MRFFVRVPLLLLGVIFLQACAQSINEKTGFEAESAAVEHENTIAEKVVTVHGQSPIQSGAKLLARKQAFKDAIRQAAIEAGRRFSTESLLGSTKVVDEWVVDNIYHMQVLAVLDEGQFCNSPYRKRIVASAFPIVTSGQINGNETQDLYSGIPREIMNMLMESGDFIGRNETHTVLYSQPDMAPEIIDQGGYYGSIVVQLAQEHGAQFVLSGVIRDFEVESTEYVRGAGVMAKLKSIMRDFVARRGVAIDVYIHDGLTGALLFQHRYTDTVIGDVWIPAGYTVGSERFKSTPAGHKVSNIIRLATQDIRKLLTCYPFSANVINVENNKVYIAAGLQDKLTKGDSLAVYSSNSSAGLQDHQLIGVINIREVQAQFSIGEMEVVSDVRKIKAGDVVKTW